MQEAQTTLLCPVCGSGKIAGERVGDSSLEASNSDKKQCMDCGWRGDVNRLIQVPFQKNPNSLELNQDEALEVAKQISNSLMQLIGANVGKPLGMCILESGLCGRRDGKNLARLLRVGCRAAHRAILEEADKISGEHSKARVLS